MILLFKIGTKFLDAPETGWRDGQLVDFRADKKYTELESKHFLILQTSLSLEDVLGSTNLKLAATKQLDFLKYFNRADSSGKYPWDTFYKADSIRPRDWFLDYKRLLDAGIIDKTTFENIYNHDKIVTPIYIDRDVSTYLLYEDNSSRLVSDFSATKGSISSGTYQIGTGAGADYATVTTFEADIAAQLTDNLTGEHQNEETEIAASVTFDTDTNGHLLKLTAESGAEHNGGSYGNGARINYPGYGYISFDETTDGHLDDIEISNLAIDASGNNSGVYLSDGGVSGTWTVSRMLFKCDASTNHGIRKASGGGVSACKILNNIVYGATETSATGIFFHSGASTVYVYNNTVIGCYNNFRQDDDALNGTVYFKNNLAQADAGGSDYVDDGAGFGTTGTNVSEDATSPDASYRSKDLHTNSVFKDYASNDYRLNSAGDATNLAILDDGEDLSGTFTVDIQGQTRSTWYIGASEILASGATSLPTFEYYHNQARI